MNPIQKSAFIVALRNLVDAMERGQIVDGKYRQHRDVSRENYDAPFVAGKEVYVDLNVIYIPEGK